MLLAWTIAVVVVTLWSSAHWFSAGGVSSADGQGATSTAAPTITPLAIPNDQALLGQGGPMTASEPVRLTIASIGVDTALIGLGLLPDGSLEVPPDGASAGWFVGAPTPGERGPAVIAGHVDWDGPAVFFDLHSVLPGDVVEVARADGSTAVFEVTEVSSYPKDEFPTDAVYGPLSFAGLRLITCGGALNASTGHYEDNVVAFAALVSSSPAAAT